MSSCNLLDLLQPNHKPSPATALIPLRQVQKLHAAPAKSSKVPGSNLQETTQVMTTSNILKDSWRNDTEPSQSIKIQEARSEI